MENENIFLLYALLMGIFITFVYDLLRIWRRVIIHNRFWVSAEDFCFWCFCAAEVFLLMYRESNGTLRWFAVLGALLGMLLYKKTISAPLVKYVSKGLRKLFTVLGRVLSFLLRPVRAVCRIVGRTVGRVAGGVSSNVRKTGKKAGCRVKKKLTGFVKMLKMVVRKV